MRNRNEWKHNSTEELYLQNFVYVTSVNNGIWVTQNTRIFMANGASDIDNWKVRQ